MMTHTHTAPPQAVECAEFQIVAQDTQSEARVGRLPTPHGTIQTPAFMPVGTYGAVKGVAAGELEALGVQLILGNTYHLHLRPGADHIRSLGGLHQFMGWRGPMLTDSGGFQVFSLAPFRTVDEEGVSFRSHLDGRLERLTPDNVIAIQAGLGSDLVMPLDECVPYPSTERETLTAVHRTTRWAEQSLVAFRRALHAGQWAGASEASGPASRPWLFGIVQGGMFHELRRQSAEAIGALDVDGFAVGGLSVGEPMEMMHELLDTSLRPLPPHRPRHLLGVGTPCDVWWSVAQGIDLFDCVVPTRNGRNALAYTADGPLHLKNRERAREERPIEDGCPCPACQSVSRAYLRHLFKVGEMLAPRLATLHNIAFFMRLMQSIRTAIAAGRFAQARHEFTERYQHDND